MNDVWRDYVRPKLSRRAVVGLFALVALSWALPLPALADDSLSVIVGAPPGMVDALDLVAQGAGFFKAEHLDVVKDHAQNAPTCAQLVATGKADVCSMSVEPVLTGYEKGLHLQAFLARSSSYSFMIAVLDDSPIRTLEDFKGTTIGELNAGSAGEIAANSMLAGAGLKRGDYSYLPVGTGAQSLDAFVNKRVAGYVNGYSDLVLFEAVGNVKIRFFRHPLLKDVPNVVYAATPATIQAKGDLLRRYSRAIVKSALFIRENPEAAARLYLQNQIGSKVTPDALASTTRQFELLESYLPASDPSNKRIGYLPPRGLQLYSQILTDYGVTHQVVPVADVVTDQFIDFANNFDHRAVITLAKGSH
jgi:NitT/TauT family transport system substrate-binding protein